MTPLPDNRQTSPVLFCLTLLLCVGVFGWGLQAKLSVYSRQTPSHPITVAKLIQDGQVNKKAGVLGSATQRSPLQVRGYNRLVTFQPPFAVRRNVQISRLVPKSIPCYLHPLFFKPPPFVA
jgi:hypothetical protein